MSKKPSILLLEPNISSRSLLGEFLNDEYELKTAHDADSAIGIAADEPVDAVVLELSLGGHSGMEFLYEFRTYADWLEVPVIIYSTVKLSTEILTSRSWQALRVASYLYKPESSMAELKSVIEKNIGAEVR